MNIDDINDKIHAWLANSLFFVNLTKLIAWDFTKFNSIPIYTRPFWAFKIAIFFLTLSFIFGEFGDVYTFFAILFGCIELVILISHFIAIIIQSDKKKKLYLNPLIIAKIHTNIYYTEKRYKNPFSLHFYLLLFYFPFLLFIFIYALADLYPEWIGIINNYIDYGFFPTVDMTSNALAKNGFDAVIPLFRMMDTLSLYSAIYLFLLPFIIGPFPWRGSYRILVKKIDHELLQGGHSIPDIKKLYLSSIVFSMLFFTISVYVINFGSLGAELAKWTQKGYIEISMLYLLLPILNAYVGFLYSHNLNLLCCSFFYYREKEKLEKG